MKDWGTKGIKQGSRGYQGGHFGSGRNTGNRTKRPRGHQRRALNDQEMQRLNELLAKRPDVTLEQPPCASGL